MRPIFRALSTVATAAIVAATAATLSACAPGPAVTGDSRDGFDTTRGMYGGNEFSALSTEGKREFAGDPKPAPVAAPATTAAPAITPATPSSPPPAPTNTPANAPANAQLASAMPPVAVASVPTVTRIAIDPNAFAAVFGSSSGPVKPSADQLMQLDSISLMAADAKRAQLQQQILACRRAGDACRLANQ